MPIAEARRRLTKEYKNLQNSPLPYITARPNEANILEWHYIIDGPPETPYFNGQYHGVVTFTTSYPYAPPAIRMYTPSGRFKPKTRLCLSISDYHPEAWNPGWSVSTILTGLLSFMTCDEVTTGSITTSYETKLQCAKQSLEFNILHNPEFCKIFPEYVQSNPQILHQRLKEIEQYQSERRAEKTGLKKMRENHVPVSNPVLKPELILKTDKKQSKEDEIRAQKNIKKTNGVELTSFNKFLLTIIIVTLGVAFKWLY